MIGKFGQIGNFASQETQATIENVIEGIPHKAFDLRTVGIKKLKAQFFGETGQSLLTAAVPAVEITCDDHRPSMIPEKSFQIFHLLKETAALPEIDPVEIHAEHSLAVWTRIMFDQKTFSGADEPLPSPAESPQRLFGLRFRSGQYAEISLPDL